MTEGIEAEKALRYERDLFNDGPVFTIEWDPTPGWPVRYVSQNVTEILGYTPEEMTSSGFLYEALIHPEDLQRLVEEVDHYRSQHIDVYEQSYRLKTNHGPYRWFYDFTQRVRDDGGQVITIRGYMFDQTEAKEAQQKLDAALEEAEAANRSKTQFLANMSHELRTPLNGLMGMAQLLETTALSEEQADYLSYVLQSGQSLARVVEDILHYTSLKRKAQKVREEPFQLDELLQEVKELHQTAAVQKSLFLRVYQEASLANKLVGDRFKLKQILGILVGNAIKFTETGTVELWALCDTTLSTPQRLRVRFQVRDTGIGIPKDKLDYIFQRFSQVDESHTRAYGGLGLGLAVAREEAAMLRGFITAESTPGRGSEFCLHTFHYLDLSLISSLFLGPFTAFT
ncbi:PAS domain-containing sensor histidine kinase [Anoxynatronum sibiricum]|uniref:histidine kinase n=1 Tax=Anoxynatronum sibiricum TaxID=210623 RepID=A0ABU9VS21_9CLOT